MKNIGTVRNVNAYMERCEENRDKIYEVPYTLSRFSFQPTTYKYI